MKDRNYFPFERNRYFYGKLLSVEDFQREQMYMNHKRRLLNRLLYGDGILCGMQVLEIDEENILIEMGAALDALGREIIVEQTTVKHLSVIDGFAEHCMTEEGNGTLFLCIEYQEEASDLVHSIGAAYNAEGKQQEFNKWKEGYHLFLTSEAPKSNIGLPDGSYEEVKTIYSGQNIRIQQVVPRFLEKNQDAVIRLLVDKNGGKEEISFQFEVELFGANWQGKNRMPITFRETEWEPADHYEVEYTIKAAVGAMDGNLNICPGSFVLERGSYIQNYPVDGQFQFQVIAEKKEQFLWDTWCQSSMEEILNPVSQPALYLAEISLIQAGDTYVINDLKSLPYRQYVWNNRLLGALKRMEIEQGPYIPTQHTESRNVDRPTVHTLPSNQGYASGVVEIPLGIGGSSGQSFFSEEIIHGLGLGTVFVSVGVIAQKKQGREIVYGTRNIFPEERGVVNVETAVKLHMDRGSFVIGIRCLEEVHEEVLTVHWLAVRNREEMEEELQLSMSIRPNMPRIGVRQSVYLEAFVGEERQSGIRWKVMDPEGGSIDESGRYTAPTCPGIYEVRGYSMEDATLEAGVYIIVGEGNQEGQIW